MKKTILATAILAALVTFGGTNDTSTLEQRLERIEQALKLNPIQANAGSATGIGTDVSNVNPLGSDADYWDYQYNEKQLKKLGILQQGWSRDADAAGNGFKMTVCCGVVNVARQLYFVFREIEFDKNGMVRKVSNAKYAVWNGVLPK